MKKLIIIFVAFFALNTAFAEGQFTQEEVDKIKTVIGYWQTWVNPLTIALCSSALTLLVTFGIITYFRKKIEEYFLDNFAQSLNVDKTAFRNTLQKMVKSEAIYSNKVLVILKGNLADDDLRNSLKKFNQNVTYKSFDEFQKMGSAINDYQLMVIDGRNQNFDEATMTNLVDKNGGTLKVILLTSDQLTNYSTYSRGASRIAKDVSRLYIPIEDLLM